MNKLKKELKIKKIDSIEEITNLDFFPSLDDELEERLESKIDINLWKWRIN